jgi:S-adenosylmethionine-diacylglycerol 3-amino-3-carboxypropyl transferase
MLQNYGRRIEITSKWWFIFAMNNRLVLNAVRNENLSSKQGLLQKLFAVWFDAFVYNQIWEDPRVDLQALRLDENSRVLTISSGGCNALNYLLESPESVTAVDLNRHHIYLLNLKLAALKHLPKYQDFFDFFGRGKGKNTGTNYLRHLAPNLDKDTRQFWESNTVGGSFIYGDRISFFTNAGLYDHSRNGYFLRFFQRVAKLFGCDPEKVLKAISMDEQRSLYEKYIDPFFDTFLVRTLGKLPVTMFGLGIPPQQYAELKADLTDGKTVIDIYRERVRRLACDFPIDENYFAWQAFARKYDTENRKALPEYLKEGNYEKLKANAERLTTVIGSATDVIKNSEPGAFNRFVFLDAQDWMNAEQMTSLWSVIAEKAEPGSRIIFRTAGAASPIEPNLPDDLRARFFYEARLSKELFKKDRASIYGGFHVYVLN